MNLFRPIGLEKKILVPVPEPMLSKWTFPRWVVNLITFGLPSSVENINKKRKIKELQLRQADLTKQISQIYSAIAKTEIEALKLKENSPNIDQDNQDLEPKFNEITEEINALKLRGIKRKVALDVKFSEIALDTINFMGQMFLNWLSLGIWGTFSNIPLGNSIDKLRTENTYLKNEFRVIKETMIKELEDINTAKRVTSKTNLILRQIDGTDVNQASANLNDKKNELLDLQDKLKQLQDELIQAKKLYNKHYIECSDLMKVADKLEKIRTENTKKIKDTKSNLHLMQQPLQNALLQERQRIDALGLQITKLKNDILKLQQDKATEFSKLKSELNPIPPNYDPSKVIEIPGAQGIDDANDLGNWSTYATRYNNKPHAKDVIAAAFPVAFKKLLDLSKDGKIKFVNCEESQYAPSACCLYRLMVLDLIEGSKLHKPDNQGYQLKINNRNVAMLPSQPVKVMTLEEVTVMKNNVATKEFKPKVSIQFTCHDDFSLDEHASEDYVPHGVDPVSLKLILNQLSLTEKDHLLNLILSPAIPNNFPHYMNTMAFMQQPNNPRVKLLEMANKLICDQAYSLAIKHAILLPGLWEENIDQYNTEEAFVKSEDKIVNFKEILTVQPVVEWVIDEDVIGGEIDYDGRRIDFEFLNLVNDMTAVQQYYLQPKLEKEKGDLLEYPHKPNSEIGDLNWAKINEQFYISHQMLGRNLQGLGGQRCLFSNLLAISVINKNELNEENVMSLRSAMARYLNKILKIKNDWENIKGTVDINDPAYKLMKEQAELAKSIKREIKLVHGCTIHKYIKWLEGLYKGSIDIDNLTPLEISIYAHTLGVRIALLPVSVKNQQHRTAAVDQYGRIQPSSSYLLMGPNTGAILFMAANEASYYGLFPKLKKTGLELDRLTDYWKSIDLHNPLNQEVI